MKLKHLFLAAFAAVFSLTACEEEEDLGPARISLNPLSLNFDADAFSQTITLTSTRDWMVSTPEWIAVNPDSGEGSSKEQTITVTVLENTGNDRSGEVVFTIGLAKAALTVYQAGPGGAITMGSGTLEDPYSVAGVIAYVNELGADVNSPEKVYVKGKISTVTEAFSAQYGNGTFKISDDGSVNGDQFTAYRVLYLGNKKWVEGNDQIKEGDDVILFGNVVNFKGNTPETQQNSAFLYSLNGKSDGGGTGGNTGEAKGSGTQADPFNVAAALDAVKNLTWTANDNYQKVGPYYVKGKVKTVKEAFGSQYGNGTFTMVDDGFDAEFTAYRVLYLGNKKWVEGNDQIKEGDEVIIYAELMNYRGNTPETVQNSGYVYSHNGNTGGGNPGGETGQPAGSGTQADPYNVAAAINAVKNLTWTANDNYEKVGPYYVKGKVKEVKEQYGSQYGNATFTMVDDGAEAEFTAYRILYFDNQKWTEGGKTLKAGDVVIIYAELMNYRGNTPETVQNAGYLYSLNGETGSGGNPGGGETATGNGTLDSPYNPKAASDVASALSSGEKSGEVYVAGKISSIKYTFSADYGTATFNISGDGTTSGTQFQCYSVYYFGGKAWVEGNTQVAVGDEVIIYGKLTNYNGTPETASKEAWIYSLNGKTEDTPAEPYLEVTKLAQTQSGFKATWKTNASGTYYSWSLYRLTDEVEDGVAYAAMGRLDPSVTSLDTAPGGQDGWYEDLIPGTTYYFVIGLYESGKPNPVVQNDPEKCYFVAKDMGGQGGDGTLTIDLTSNTTFTAVTDDVLKKGYIAEVEGFKVGTYQYKSTSAPVAPDQYSLRVYKSAIFYIEAPDGCKITSLLFKANDYSNGKYCVDLTEVETGNGSAAADTGSMTIGPWTGESGLIYLQAAAAQARLENVTVTFVTE